MNYRAIIILSLISVVPLCSAMEIPTKNLRIKALCFPKNDTIIIAGDHCCEVYSTRTGLSSILSDDGNDGIIPDPIFDMALSSDNKKLALTKVKKIVLYDITGDIKKEKDFEQELHFGWDHQISFGNVGLNICYTKNSPHVLCHYHCVTKKLSQGIVYLDHPIELRGIRHPIIITDLDNMRERERNRKGDFFKWDLLPYTYCERFPQGEFNYDGTWTAINMSGEKYRFLPKGNTKANEFEISSEEKNNNDDLFYIAIAFHKNNITAALLRNDGAVEFWDYKKQLLLGITPGSVDEKMLWKDRNNRDQLLCFSPDCKSLVASVGNKIFLCGTPPGAIYIKDTWGRCGELFFVLKNYCIETPKDIICNIMKDFLRCSELVHEEKMCEIISKYRSEMAAQVLANQEEVSDEKDIVDEDEEDQGTISDEEKDDFYTCTCQIRKTYAKALAVVAGIAAVYAMINI